MNRRQFWKLINRTFNLVLLVALPILLFLLLRATDWNEVFHLLREYKAMTLLAGMLLSLCSYAIFSSFDVLSRFYIGHPLPVRRVLTVAFVCNAFNLNLSSWVGAVALRYRLYGRLGMTTGDITRILTFSLITNWYGYLLLAGGLFVCGFPNLPDDWSLGQSGLRLIGLLLLAVGAAYLLACGFARRRAWGWKRYRLRLPGWRLAALQGIAGAGNWSMMALLIYSLLPDTASYPEVLATLLISSIAGVVLHVPAGLGVLETVFLTVLRDHFSRGELLAAIIGYRVLYFLIPLLLACLVYLWLERHAKKLKRRAERREEARTS
ncbi:lysylphosphatidylglycerol synthase domain-containing protein [Pseudomonas sp. ZM23]|uniref:Lysylphosphatidylglycerol synthase domain-containing protein n=1 Tax=Pseudomonas triclosanedens TaxID=2961893 RepID=A0ABY7A5Z7_9PSED|nr:lysylphosphatidylglycerol synthase domain-containing protein [Pseudomonas triclosanedens]MCP8466255.1 lysylphosphatidylglycerol synthase domain-containing protein [Pseudomonas triclosanedens]MCP8471781.1 lysylphosphatidylglycerol synthase domain-containing protein [Pseudomonas triclosanedens]MCP8478476.1 lysylphosphatidylglycerol synthase domain-containing protein [Pseudomonas triclosanedens]WAI52327.1 lysylphosphatidylglycerol synthase domain-containing protein [Pseudomonas triclosanedens]